MTDGLRAEIGYRAVIETTETDMRMVLVAIVGVMMAGCAFTDTADMYPMNREAEVIGTPRVEFMRGVRRGPVQVFMPDGEVLLGTFTLAVQGGMATTFGTFGSMSTYASAAGGNFVANAVGPRTRMNCQGATSQGHGSGVCQTNGGAEYQVQL